MMEYHHGKNIKVCPEWSDYIPFRDWALKNNYNDTLTIDRIDSDKDYTAENCRWITLEENSKRATALWWKLRHLDGTEHIIYSMNDFCKNNNLKSGTMTLVAQGKNSHHKGWTCLSAPSYEEACLLEVKTTDAGYVVYNDDVLHRVLNLTEFCKQNNLKYTSLAHAARTNNTDLLTGGWRCQLATNYIKE